MDTILIKGGNVLRGEIEISGAKNAALPLMAASLLCDGVLRLTNLPHLNDIASMAELLNQLGVGLCFNSLSSGLNGHEGKVLEMDASGVNSTVAPYDIVRKMRASILVLGPLLTRFHKAKVSLPGGCAIGTRPVNLHIDALRKLGATIDIEDGYIIASAPQGLVGSEILMPIVSVTGTENIMMAACLAKGKTVIINAAREPEIIDLGECLQKMGADIHGLGTDRIEIIGTDSLHSAEHEVIPDRIEIGTYAMAAGLTGGELLLKGAKLNLIEAVAATLKDAGLSLTQKSNGIHVKMERNRLTSINMTTEPFPGFPTDLQAQFMALMCTAHGTSLVTETIFENRFMHVPELSRMGANILIQGSSAMIHGVERLKGAQVMATDLRASVSLVLAALAAEGETVVSRVYHLDRGYERVEEKLSACGAQIFRKRK